MTKPVVQANSELVKMAAKHVRLHQPVRSERGIICRRCGRRWVCPIHANGQIVLQAANVRLEDFEEKRDLQPPDTTKPRPRSHRRQPQSEPRVRVEPTSDGGKTVTITPVEGATVQLPRIRPHPEASAAPEKEGQDG
ncbi:hypothetical protein [Fodinicola acaciae]|uniref:hypothetical protein n=1 Tax=Fodinicola acaciae TaxID=2681555 RepID=UPI0013D66BDA|nr:hypothetical protein [Fodinicola acaciae]